MTGITSGFIDFSDFTDRQESLLTVDIVLIVVVAIVVSLRILTRLFVVKKLGIDDILMLLAALCGIAFAALSIICVFLGMGAHVASIENLFGFLDVVHADILLYATTISFTKISVVACFLRILPTRKTRITVWTTGVITLGAWIAFLVVDSALGKNWMLNPERARIFVNFSYAFAGITGVTDFVLCFAPMPTFWRLGMSTKEKCSLCCLFATGIIATISSIFRTAQLHRVISTDVSYQSAPVYLWSTVEVGLGLVCACIPSLRALGVQMFPRDFVSEIEIHHLRDCNLRAGATGLVCINSTTPLQKPSGSGVGIGADYESGSDITTCASPGFDDTVSLSKSAKAPAVIETRQLSHAVSSPQPQVQRNSDQLSQFQFRRSSTMTLRNEDNILITSTVTVEHDFLDNTSTNASSVKKMNSFESRSELIHAGAGTGAGDEDTRYDYVIHAR